MLNVNHIPSQSSEIMNSLVTKATSTDKPTRQSFKKDMGLTMIEFSRALPKAIQGAVTLIDEKNTTYRVDTLDGVAFIACHPLANRELGSLSLPRMIVEIEFCDFDAKQIETFFHRFDLQFLRMGG